MLSKGNTSARPSESSSENAINRIVEGTIIEGEIRCESNIRIDGVFTGNIGTKGRLVIGPTGRIDGNVICQNAEIEGFVKGKINVQQLLSLKSTARVEGDIFTDKLAIEPGAAFSGACSMGQKQKEAPKVENQGSPAATATPISK